MAGRTRVYTELGVWKEVWNAWCARRGVTSNEGLRQLVHAELQHESVPPDLHRAVSEKRWRQVSFRLTDAELEEVTRRARMRGFLRARWLAALVRAHLDREAQPDGQELQRLAESNQHLAVIRMQLAMLVRRGDAPRELEPLCEAIDTHLQTVAQLLRSNLDRWSR
jgi:hypothetical protein